MKNNAHLVDVLHAKHDLVLWSRKKIMVAKKLIQLACLAYVSGNG